MADSFLLDTDVLSDVVRNPRGSVARHIATVGERQVCTSIVVAAELRFGAAKRASDRLSRQLDAVLSRLEILPLDAPADWRYAEVRTYLEAQGTPIGPNDMLIAAQVLALGMTLVSGNVGEFSRIPQLKVENWLDG